MKKIILLFIGVLLFACSSDCIECHPKLKNMENNPKNKYYKEHHFLKSCTRCHSNHPTKGMDKCGADCFDCHSREKLTHTPIPEHQRLKTCTKCHKDNVNEIFHQDNNFIFKK